jgi:hypothetical protein
MDPPGKDNSAIEFKFGPLVCSPGSPKQDKVLMFESTKAGEKWGE